MGEKIVKITAEIIDRSVIELTDLLLLWDTQQCPEAQNMCCGYIQGMLDLANRLKEVLKT